VKPASGGVLAIKGDGNCCYYCAYAIGALTSNEDSLRGDWTPCSPSELKVSRNQIKTHLDKLLSLKRPFYTTDEEFENEEVLPHLNGSLQSYKSRMNGDIVKGKEMHGSYIDLGLYTLFSNVLVVIINAERITPSSLATEDAKACTELWYDSIAEEAFPKTRVVCVILHREHFQLGVVR
jgi:hypothetical protein